MKRFVPLVVLLLVLSACGKRDEPAESPSAPSPQATREEEKNSAVTPPQAGGRPSYSGREAAQSTDGKYTVVKGDTLYEIAKKNNLNYRELAEWNRIKDARRLRVGQEIRLSAPGN